MKVKIKDWYDMTESFSLDEDGNISCYCGFTTDMKEYCGKVIEVSDDEVLTFDDVEIFEYHGWFFTDEMFEVIEE